MRLSRCALLLFIVMSIPNAVAQQIATGVPAYGSFSGGPFDAIDLGNLNAHFGISVVNKPGRQLPFFYKLVYDSSIWTPQTVNGVLTWQPDANWGWAGQTQVKTGYAHYYTTTGKYWDNLNSWWCRWTQYNYDFYVDWSGTPRDVSGSFYYSDACAGDSSSGSVIANDGSGYTMNVLAATSVSITTPGGAVLYPPTAKTGSSGTITDPNGNQISVATANGTTTFTDTLGTSALSIAGLSPTQVNYTYLDSTGQAQSVTVNYSQYNVQTNFSCNVSPYKSGISGTMLISAIIFPNGDTYGFGYENSGAAAGAITGRISSITLPSGGKISYDYTANGTSPAINCSDGTTMGLARTTTDSATPWLYNRSNVSGSEWATTVLSPPVNSQNQKIKSIYYFQQAKKSDGTSSIGFYETRREFYGLSGSLDSSIDTCYSSGCSPSLTATVALPITSKSVFRNQNNNKCVTSVSAFNFLGQTTSFSEYDFGSYTNGSCASGSLLRKTTTSYLSLGNGASLPGQVTMFAGTSSAPVAKTTYAYDGTAVSANPSGTSVPQHSGISGARGNLTSVTKWGNTSPDQTTTLTYWDTGNVKSVTDPGSHTISYDWSDNYYNTSNHNTQALLTTVTYPQTGSPSVNHVEIHGYYYPSGLAWKNVDQNGNATTVASYDRVLRPTEIDKPDGGKTTFSYSTSSGGQPIVDTKTLVTGTTWFDTQSEADYFGRPSRTIRQNGAGSFDQTDTCYDVLGRVLFISNPYQGSGFTTAQKCSGAGNSYSYDHLSRPMTVTHANGTAINFQYLGAAVATTDEGINSGNTIKIQKVQQADALGNLSSVCEVSGTTYQNDAPSNCGQDIALTGFKTSYSYDVLGRLTSVAQGIQQRVYNYNTLGQLIGVGIPEMQAVGSTSPTVFTTFTYDAEGKLITRVRPKANQTGTATTTTTYNYDPLHRLATVNGVPAISYSDTTLAVNYTYDTATNGVGAFASGYVGNIARTTVTAYDATGRISTTKQCTLALYRAGTCGIADFTDALSYDLAGDVTSEAQFYYTLNYNYDSGLRLAKITSSLSDANHPGTLVSAAQYNAWGQVASASLGNGLTQVNAYDANTGRILSSAAGTNCNLSTSSCATYQYYFGNMSYAGDGTVLGANDSVNGTWTHSYDDIGRIVTSNQSGGATYNFGVDRYANRVSQSVPGGSGPQFVIDKYTNKITTSGFAYDAAGNLTNDAVHSYQYDAESRIIGVDNYGTTFTAIYRYDAFGRRIEKQLPSQATDYVYDRNSNAATRVDDTTGAWLGSDIFDGSHLATYYGGSSGTTYFNHVDWLGSERVRTNVSGLSIETCRNLAYGDTIPATTLDCTGTDVSPFHFTGYERDTESGLDHSLYRYYNPRIGRFVVPDLMAGYRSSPQSLNKLAYVQNGPSFLTDPLGLDCVYLTDDGENVGSTDNNSSLEECGQTGGFWIDGTYQSMRINDDGGYTFYGNLNGDSTVSYGSDVRAVALSVSVFSALGDVIFHTIPGIIGDGLNELIFAPGNQPEPYRLFTTRYCGPGGAGQTTGKLDEACKAHDDCFNAAGLSADSNTSSNSPMSLNQAVAAQACNQALFNYAASHPNKAGSKAVQYWLTNGDKTKIFTGYQLLAPGTEAVP